MSERAYRIDRKEWRRLLKEAGLTQGQLAAQVGMHQNSLSRKIRGKRDFTLEEFIRIAFELGVSIPLTFANDDIANVVRCKDCEFNDDGYRCPFKEAGWGYSPDRYCSFGERKEDEG